MKSIVVTTIAILFLGACSTTSNREFNATEIDNLKPGITTIEEAKNRFGTPYAEMAGSTGAKALKWSFSKQSIIPLALPTDYHSLTILFDKTDKMVRILARDKEKFY